MEAIVKWPGGKTSELKHIVNSLPDFRNYYEPFVGGGSVYMSMHANHYFINDKSEELTSLYNAILEKNTIFFEALEEIIDNWNGITLLVENERIYWISLYKNYVASSISEETLFELIEAFFNNEALSLKLIFPAVFNNNVNRFIAEIEKSLIAKVNRMKAIESIRGALSNVDIIKNIETAFKGAYYMYLRYLYNSTSKYKINDPRRIALFYFIRNYAYSGMFRYNRSGGFNVPYGGIAYNSKSLAKKATYLKSEELIEHLGKTTICSLDFEEFLNENSPTKDDFVFLDPPYDLEFSEYAKNPFTKDDHLRLCNYLLNVCNAKWMMIIKKTEFIYDLYNQSNIEIQSFDKKYLVSFMNRNDRAVEHLLIKSY